ncbi:MAG: hypothetical protein ACI9VR_004201 [Cognaticolwellia sp.]|jgi:hypothetical protein
MTDTLRCVRRSLAFWNGGLARRVLLRALGRTPGPRVRIRSQRDCRGIQGSFAVLRSVEPALVRLRSPLQSPDTTVPAGRRRRDCAPREPSVAPAPRLQAPGPRPQRSGLRSPVQSPHLLALPTRSEPPKPGLLSLRCRPSPSTNPRFCAPSSGSGPEPGNDGSVPAWLDSTSHRSAVPSLRQPPAPRSEYLKQPHRSRPGPAPRRRRAWSPCGAGSVHVS